MLQHEKKQYQCTECGFEFYQRSNLVKHIQRIHQRKPDNNKQKNNQYVCPICKRVVKLKASLARHLKTMHPSSNLNVYDAKTRRVEPEEKNEQPVTFVREELSEFSTNLIDSLNEENVPAILPESNVGGENVLDFQDMQVNLENNLDLRDENLTEEICLSMPDITETEQDITLGNNRIERNLFRCCFVGFL